MTKEQLKMEVNKRVEVLRSYMAQVQKIENYRYDRECQDFFPRVTGAIRKMNSNLQQLLSLSDADFSAYNVARFIKDMDTTVSGLETAFQHIKSRGPIHRPIRISSGKKLPKSHQDYLSKNEPDEPGMA